MGQTLMEKRDGIMDTCEFLTSRVLSVLDVKCNRGTMARRTDWCRDKRPQTDHFHHQRPERLLPGGKQMVLPLEWTEPVSLLPLCTLESNIYSGFWTSLIIGHVSPGDLFTLLASCLLGKRNPCGKKYRRNKLLLLLLIHLVSAAELPLLLIDKWGLRIDLAIS